MLRIKESEQNLNKQEWKYNRHPARRAGNSTPHKQVHRSRKDRSGFAGPRISNAEPVSGRVTTLRVSDHSARSALMQQLG